MAGNAEQTGGGLKGKSPDEVRVVEALDVINFEVNHMKQNTASQEKLNAGAIKIPATVESSFTPCNLERQELFAVRPGVPAVDALGEASCILSELKGQLEFMAMGEADIPAINAWSFLRAVDSAKAVIDSVQVGLERAQ